MKPFEKLLAIQSELKCNKSQYNQFGKYNYRSCEDILEAVKPLLAKHKATLFLTDEIKQVGARYYVEATAHFVDIESGEEITVKAFAREEENKKGMDGSQVTGASSSYARKYSLNGLFDIDDTKDSDATNTHGKEPTPPKEPTPRQTLITKLKEKGIDVNAYAAEKGLSKQTTDETYRKLLAELED